MYCHILKGEWIFGQSELLISFNICLERFLYDSEERNALQLLSHLIGLPQKDVKVSLTRGSLAFRVERDLFSGCDCWITTWHA